MAKRNYIPDNDFFDVKDISRLPVPTLAEASIMGYSARIREFMGRSITTLIDCAYCAHPDCIHKGAPIPLAQFSPDHRKLNGAHSYCKSCRAKHTHKMRSKR